MHELSGQGREKIILVIISIIITLGLGPTVAYVPHIIICEDKEGVRLLAVCTKGREEN